MRRHLAFVALLVIAGPWQVAIAGDPLPVKTVQFDAPSVGRQMKYNVCLPARYDATSDRYPVLYLLHGLTSNYTAWATMGVPTIAAEYDLIVVMPDVGNTWYVNWAESEGGQKNRWEDFIIQDLIGHVDQTYRTIAAREGRAINGLSMGGYGGLMLGLRHPELFCSIGSHSGALAFAERTAEQLDQGEQPEFFRRELSDEPNKKTNIDGFNSPRERTPRGKIFATREACNAHDPFQLVLALDRAKLPYIYIDCGTDDRLIDTSQRFCRLLLDHNIPFTYAQSPGGHLPYYWAREVGHSMAVQYHLIQRSLAQAEKERAKAGAAAAGGK